MKKIWISLGIIVVAAIIVFMVASREKTAINDESAVENQEVVQNDTQLTVAGTESQPEDQNLSQTTSSPEILTNDNKKNMTTQLANGLIIEVLKDGTGEAMTKAGQNIAVHYTGTLIDGTKFDSSLDRGQPFSFVLGAGMVIKGWDEGLVGMKIGEKRKLTIPAELGYGAAGVGPIPGNATLIFEVELLAIQ